MPWKHDTSDYEANPDFDVFRGAAAELLHDGQYVGLLACQVEQEWPSRGGKLWWRRWGRGHEYVYLVAQATPPQGRDLTEVDWLYAGNVEEAHVLDELRRDTYAFDLTPSEDARTDFICMVSWVGGEAKATIRTALLPNVEG